MSKKGATNLYKMLRPKTDADRKNYPLICNWIFCSVQIGKVLR